MTRRRFRFKLRFLAFWFLFVVLFCALGVWQLHRYAEKKRLLAAELIHVSVEGHYVNDQIILIQNRMYQSRPGFEVLTPIEMPGKKQWLLVDRGWIAQEGENKL